MVLTGAVVWWPGLTRWKRSLGVKVTAGWRRFNWDLHSALGFWLFLFMLMWGISGWYLGMPEPLTNLVDRFSDPEGVYGERPGDIALTWLSRLHFGRWRNPGWGPWLQAAWAIVGLVPAIMFVTGTIMWWNRVVRRRRSPAMSSSPHDSGNTPCAPHPHRDGLVPGHRCARARDARRGEEPAMHVRAERGRYVGQGRRAGGALRSASLVLRFEAIDADSGTAQLETDPWAPT